MQKRNQNLKKSLMSLVLAASMVFSAGIGVHAAETKNKSTSYRTITEIYDWGPATPKIIVDLGKLVDKNSVTKDTFKVHVVRKELRADTLLLGSAEGDREITNVYVADKDGNAADKGRFVVIEMKVGPALSLGSPMNYSITAGLNAWIDCKYTITQQEDIITASGKLSGLVITDFTGDTKPLVDDFSTGTGTYNNVTLSYASYAPAKDSEKKPLIVWLHGMGEGGSDATIPISGNKADNFASSEIQSYFDGAYVLAPQAPTFWMDGYTSFGDGTSKYEEAIMALIKDYVAKNNKIDTSRIYIGGDSNGGYMTMLMARDYTNYFAAAFPTCEALSDKLISDSDIQKLKNIPLWFTAAKTDTVVDPNLYVLSTYKRLVQAGAANVHLSLFDKVVDTTGLYNNADGTPYEYNGHWSWIYVYNNECANTIDGKTTTIMEWLAAQKLN